MKNGDRIQWTYEHHLNSRSSVMRTKVGVLIGTTGSVKNDRYVSGSIAIVHFDGNKGVSKVPYKDIVPEGTEAKSTETIAEQWEKYKADKQKTTAWDNQKE